MVMGKRICGLRVCLQFVRDAWSYQMTKIRWSSNGGVVMLLGGKDEFVVLVVKRLVEKSKAE